MDVWTNLDRGVQFSDGSVIRYHKADPHDGSDHAIVFFSGFDGSLVAYDITASVFSVKLPNGGMIKADSGNNTCTISMPAGSTMNLDADTINIDGATQVNISSDAIILAGGGPAMARVGDTTICPAGVGHVTSGSQVVQSG